MRDTIETPRLQLRPFQTSDALRVADLVGDWDVARMLARVPHPYAVEDAQKWFDTMPAARACGRGYTYAIAMACTRFCRRLISLFQPPFQSRLG
jgi:RimJ/RimL family protein N-acetyltransferase